MSESLSWNDMKYSLQPWIKDALEIMGYDRMTPVQASTIPMFSGNKDVVVESVTGSGKTMAFVIPIIEKILGEDAHSSKLKKGHFHSLIITPTRELSTQIHSVIQSLLDHCPDHIPSIKAQVVVGTSKRSIRDDITLFLDKRPQIIVGTPGRLLEFLENPNVKTSSCSMAVLDEADRLLDASFLGDVQKILSILPKQRRTGLFSATISGAGDHIFKTGLRNPVKITVKSKNNSPSSLGLYYTVVDPDEKLRHLLSILNDYKFKKCIAYFPTCISVTYFYSFVKYLQNSTGHLTDEIEVYSLHGKLQTASRLKTLERFTETLGKAVLLTTDVAARGLDIADVDLVLQLDPPTDTSVFLHRCGRTGRANRVGKAITFLASGREEDFVSFLEVKDTHIEEMALTINGISKEELYQIFKKWLMEDRARFDLGVRSFVAFIKYYSNHSASSIFRLQSLDYVALAKLYGLFRLPKMPEITKYLKDDKIKDGWIIENPIDLDDFAYKDKKKESARQMELKNLQKINDKKKLKHELKKKNMAWSNKTETKESKAERKMKVALKRKVLEEQVRYDEDRDEEEVREDWKNVILQNKKRKGNSNGMQGNFDDL